MMAPIVNSIEISRRPEDVFTYLTNPAQLPDWQESAVAVRGDSLDACSRHIRSMRFRGELVGFGSVGCFAGELGGGRAHIL
jgi:uncharacterized protein YndB with AHSA1/START domain